MTIRKAVENVSDFILDSLKKNGNEKVEKQHKDYSDTTRVRHGY